MVAAPRGSRFEKDRLRLLQARKIETYGQGCDGPIEKVVRDLLIEDAVVSLIDEKAGVEHFGRRIPDRMDIILGVLDCTRESVSIARRISRFAMEMRTGNVWFVLNKAESQALPRVAPLDAHWRRYEAWFQNHEAAYLSELLALRDFLPRSGLGVEIGVGSGRFATPLGIGVGSLSQANGGVHSMENTFWTALGTSLLAGIVTSLGIYTIRRFADWGQRNTTLLMCFAAGVLISASFVYQLLLDDPVLWEELSRRILEGLWAPAALRDAVHSISAEFEAMLIAASGKE